MRPCRNAQTQAEAQAPRLRVDAVATQHRQKPWPHTSVLLERPLAQPSPTYRDDLLEGRMTDQLLSQCGAHSTSGADDQRGETHLEFWWRDGWSHIHTTHHEVARMQDNDASDAVPTYHDAGVATKTEAHLSPLLRVLPYRDDAMHKMQNSNSFLPNACKCCPTVRQALSFPAHPWL